MRYARYCFAVNNNRSKKWIKFTQCSCSSKSLSWKVFPAQRISLLCQREVFRARYRHWNINLAPSFSSAPRGGSNSRQKAWPIINGQKMCWVISTNWTVCFNRMPPVSAVNYASTSRQESRKACYCRACRNFSICIRELSWSWVAMTVR